jgi:hypothetical protein
VLGKAEKDLSPQDLGWPRKLGPSTFEFKIDVKWVGQPFGGDGETDLEGSLSRE